MAEHEGRGIASYLRRLLHRHRVRQIVRGIAGASVVLLRAAGAGGAPSRAYLLGTVSGPERRALAWALHDDGDRPLSAKRCREAAAELAGLTPDDINAAP